VLRERPVLLSALPPTRRQERLALALAVLLFAALLATLPYGNREMPRSDAFIPIVDTILFLSDLITAVLLYAQFSVLRSPGLLALATGYLYTAIIIVPHLVTFPGVFAVSGFSGGLQSTVWLYIFWHLGLPPAAIAYALLKGSRRGAGMVRGSSRNTILASVLASAAVASALTLLVTVGAGHLPTIMLDATHANSLWHDRAAPVLISLSLVSIVLLWRGRSSVLDLWLLIVLWAWFIETILLSTTSARFTLVWYAGRAFGLLSSGLVLLILLSESTMLYARLALSVVAQDREREGRKTTLDIIVRSMAHELQQPLSAIALNSDAANLLLAQTPTPLEEVLASLQDIAADGRRASEIVASTRTMVTGVVQHMALLDIDTLVRETLQFSAIELRIHDVSLRLQVAPQLPQVRGNRGQLQQVLMNLITNALDAMSTVTDRPRTLCIRAAALAPAAVSIEVEDNGVGIDPRNMTRIFEAFFTMKSNGTGLGLAICRSIVDAHGGELAAIAGNPHGCTFHLVLPVAPPARIPRPQL
jgi:signal transduction histidine kinase